MRIELHVTEPLKSDAGSNSLDSIRVVLETESRQRDRNAGLSVAVELTNTSAKAIQLQKPDDSIQIEVLDEQGRPVDIPRPPPAALVNTRRRAGPHPNEPEIITLDPAAHYWATLVVREIRISSAPERNAPLSPGAYQIRLKVLLLAADPNLAYEQSFRVLHSDRFWVKFGESL